MTAAAGSAREAAQVAAGLVAAAGVIAVTVRVLGAARVREQLAFPFAGVDPEAATAFSIFEQNVTIVGTVVIAALLIQAPRLWQDDGRRTAIGILLSAACDTFVGLTVVLNVLIVGAALGAYDERMLVAMLPHGPFELAGSSLALALYRRARRGPRPGREIAACTGVSLFLLTVAAVLETYVTL